MGKFIKSLKGIFEINKKTDYEKNLKDKKSDNLLQNRFISLKKFRSKHKKNLLFEKEIGIKTNNTINNEFPTKFINAKIFKNYYIQQWDRNQLFNRLSIPKINNCISKSNNLFGNPDFRGLLLGDLDSKALSQKNNEFIKAVSKSKILDNYQKSQNEISLNTCKKRPKTAKSVFGIKYDVMPEHKLRELEIITKTLSDFKLEKEFDEPDKIKEEIEEFDSKLKNYKKIHKRIGFSKLNFAESIDFMTTEGYLARKRQIKENN